MVSFHLARFKILPVDTERKCRARNTTFWLPLKPASYLSVTRTYHILFLKSTPPRVKLPMLLLQALKGQATIKNTKIQRLCIWDLRSTLQDHINIVFLSALNAHSCSRDSPCMIPWVPGSAGIGWRKVWRGCLRLTFCKLGRMPGVRPAG